MKLIINVKKIIYIIFSVSVTFLISCSSSETQFGYVSPPSPRHNLYSSEPGYLTQSGGVAAAISGEQSPKDDSAIRIKF